VLGLVALCGQVGEGSAGDWSAVYLHVNLGAAPGVAAVALGAFSVTMALGRVAGDRLGRPVRPGAAGAGQRSGGRSRAGGWPADRHPGRGHRRLSRCSAWAWPGSSRRSSRSRRGWTRSRRGAISGGSPRWPISGLLSGPVAIGAIRLGRGPAGRAPGTPPPSRSSSPRWPASCARARPRLHSSGTNPGNDLQPPGASSGWRFSRSRYRVSCSTPSISPTPVILLPAAMASSCEGAESGPVYVAAMADVYDRHHAGLVVDPVDDPIGAAACAEPVIERRQQALCRHGAAPAGADR